MTNDLPLVLQSSENCSGNIYTADNRTEVNSSAFAFICRNLGLTFSSPSYNKFIKLVLSFDIMISMIILLLFANQAI